MAEPITDEFAMASGIAALVLMQVTLEQMQQLGMPSTKIDEIINQVVAPERQRAMEEAESAGARRGPGWIGSSSRRSGRVSARSRAGRAR